MPVQILDPEIQQRIAAGEVIDRPASVVKELIENAIDAGARAISVEVRDGGLGLIRVSDDGCGMTRADAALAPARFSTSKISALPDLEQIRTLGFRGEALNSIVAVAEVELLTRAEGELEGTHVCATGAQIEVAPAASPVGTSVTVSGLFARIPARRRFLKSRTRESELIQQAAARYALAYPQTAFRLVVDGRERLVAPRGSALARIGAVWGRDVAGEMTAVAWQALDLRVQGYVSRPAIARSRRSGQTFFVNGRPVRSGLLAVMVERPYSGRLPPGRHPLCVIQIEVDPRYVDVNVHPQKAEVRFSQERAIYGAVSSAVREALNEFPPSTQWAGATGAGWPFGGLFSTGAVHEAAVDYQIGELRVLAQLHNLYILTQTVDGLAIIDQHAAHEQVLFERLAQGDERVSLSPPAPLGLLPREIEALERIAPALDELGIEVEPFGGPNFVVRTLPASLQEQDAAGLVTALIEESQRRQGSPDELRDRLTMKAACLGAVKAGDRLSIEQMQRLVQDLARVWSPATCPHGRPALAAITLEELDRRFGRS